MNQFSNRGANQSHPDHDTARLINHHARMSFVTVSIKFCSRNLAKVVID